MRGLHGSIPAELSLLTQLVRLNLSTTELVGDLTIFSTLTQLSSLDLSTCGWAYENGCACEDTWDPNEVAYTTYISGSLDALLPLTQLREIHLNGSSSSLDLAFQQQSRFHLNHITGSFSALAHLTHLTSLNIANAGYNSNASLCNQVMGEMPHWMLRDSERVSIDVADNLVTLPYDIGKLHTSEPSSLEVAGWGLIGPLPPSIGELTSLRRLNLSSNGFSGSIRLLSTLTQLIGLDLSSNGFSGSIRLLSTLTQLTSLDVSGGIKYHKDISYGHGYLSNNFSGELPLWMLRKNLTGQMELRLHSDGDGAGDEGRCDINYIGLPHDIGSLNGTVIKEELDLSNQGLGGQLPASIGNLALLRRLNLADNGFSGSIGPLSSLTQLTSLDVSGCYSYAINNFSGELPLWMLRKNLTGQMELQLHGGDDCYYPDSNHIGLPHDIGSLNGTVIKEELDLSNQGLGGQLPASIGNLTLLRRLNLSRNGFSGSIGPLSKLTGLEALGLGCIDSSTGCGMITGCGMVTGSFVMLSRLSQLRSLDLSGQGVGGPLEGLSHLTKLTSLVLAYSQAISGTIPPSFVQLSQLATLRLQCCRLTGNVPALDVLERSPGYPQQCELTEVGNPRYTDCSPYPGQANNFSCPLPAGAAGNCLGWCS
jgi:Leucine-rich repeat (LRR) protein